jgi:hypothetical protein
MTIICSIAEFIFQVSRDSYVSEAIEGVPEGKFPDDRNLKVRKENS